MTVGSGQQFRKKLYDSFGAPDNMKNYFFLSSEAPKPYVIDKM